MKNKILLIVLLSICKCAFPVFDSDSIPIVKEKNSTNYLNISYSQALSIAKTENKAVIFYFTGMSCINSRKMESEILSNSKIQKLIADNFIFVTLYVDDRTALKEVLYKKDLEGEVVKIETVGDQNNFLEESKFNVVIQPFIGFVTMDGVHLGEIWYTKEFNEFEKQLIAIIGKWKS